MCLTDPACSSSRQAVNPRIRASRNWYNSAGRSLRDPSVFSDCLPTQIALPISRSSNPGIYSLTDGQIADVLNAEGLQTVKGRPWSARRVMDFRLSNGIPSGFTLNAQLRLTDNGYLTTAEAAAHLEINQTTVQKWYKLGLLQGKHASSQKALWIA